MAVTQVSIDIDGMLHTTFVGKTYYECHVTMVLLPTDEATRAAKKLTESLGWKFSQIEGDIALGDGVKSYATMHYNSRTPVEKVMDLLNGVADNLSSEGINVIRRKVELVIYDDRSTKVQPGTCEGACVGCHLDDYEEEQLYKVRTFSNLPVARGRHRHG